MKKTAIIYRTDTEWVCETAGIGHHAGGDSAFFRTAKEAKEYAKAAGYRVKRCAECDS